MEDHPPISILYHKDVIVKIVEDRYDIEKITKCILLNQGVNSVYLLTTSKRKIIVRITPLRNIVEFSKSSYEDELYVLDQLTTDNLPVCSFIPDKFGINVNPITFGNTSVFLILFEYFDGESSTLAELDLDTAFYLGGNLAELHKSMKKIAPLKHRFDMDPFVISSLSEKYIQTYAEDENSILLQQMVSELEVKLREYNTLFPNKYGLIHGDFHSLNYKIKHGEMRIFDFDFLSYGPHLLDLASLSSSEIIWRGMKKLDEAVLIPIFRGYQQVKNIEKREFDYFNYFELYRLLLLLQFWIDPIIETFGYNRVNPFVQSLLKVLHNWDEFKIDVNVILNELF